MNSQIQKEEMEDMEVRESRESIAEMYPEAILWSQELDECVIGVTEEGRVVYSIDRIIHTMKVSDEDLTYEDILDYISYNMLNAYLGEGTPIHVWEFKLT